ncbi:MAG: fibronectin type III domain-containing protein [Candidatus Omnitrophica bacterium]|nr:fibronectin type III domain-containing protein [Candidatus Omnitrophota bacterium]
MKRVITFIFLFITVFFNLYASDVPIIFIHGHKSEAVPEDSSDKEEGGWKTWYPTKSDGITLKYHTAMTKIVAEKYKGYQYGLKTDGTPAYACDENTQLKPMPDAKRIYNFSFYHRDGSPGTIGDNSIIECMYGIDRRTGQVVRKGSIPPEYFVDVYKNASDSGSWAHNLASFIEKVLIACYGFNWQSNPFAKVDIVAHSMGGLVIRFAIKYLTLPSGDSVKNRIRKVLMVGTPNHPYTYPLDETVHITFMNCKTWQIAEHWEMGVDKEGENIKFKEVSTGREDEWGNLLGYEESYGIKMATIAGNRKRIKLGGILIGPDDGIVYSNQVNLACAQFNPVIYASHDHAENKWYGMFEDIGASGEVSLTECTYVTEFIKVWMIDDEDTYYGAYFTDKPRVGLSNYPPYSVRVWPNINDYKKALTINVSLIRPDNGTVIKEKGIPIHRCHQEFLPWFVGAPVIHTNWTSSGGGYTGNVTVRVTINDMLIGRVDTKENKCLVWERDNPAKTNLIYPNGGEILTAGNTYQIKWGTNDGFVRAYFWYSKDGGINWKFIGNTPIDAYTYSQSPFSYSWVIPLSEPPGNYSNCKVKVTTWLDGIGVTGLSDESDNPFTIVVPDWKPKNLIASVISEEKVKLVWQNYSGFIYDSIQIFRNPDLYGNNQFGRIGKVSGSSESYIDNTVEWNKTYFYKIRAWENNFPSEYSNIVQVTTNILNPPTNLSANSSYPYNSVNLTWKDNSNYETGYEIWRKGINQVWQKIGQTNANTTSYTDNSVSRFSDYFYKVRAVKDGIYSQFSNSVWVTTSPVLLSKVAVDTFYFNGGKGKKIIFKNGKLHTVFNNNKKIYYAVSEDDGITWDIEEIVDCTNQPNTWVEDACLVIDKENRIYVFYEYNAPAEFRIKYRVKVERNWTSEYSIPRYGENPVAVSGDDDIFLIFECPVDHEGIKVYICEFLSPTNIFIDSLRERWIGKGSITASYLPEGYLLLVTQYGSASPGQSDSLMYFRYGLDTAFKSIKINNQEIMGYNHMHFIDKNILCFCKEGENNLRIIKYDISSDKWGWFQSENFQSSLPSFVKNPRIFLFGSNIFVIYQNSEDRNLYYIEIYGDSPIIKKITYFPQFQEKIYPDLYVYSQFGKIYLGSIYNSGEGIIFKRRDILPIFVTSIDISISLDNIPPNNSKDFL